MDTSVWFLQFVTFESPDYVPLLTEYAVSVAELVSALCYLHSSDIASRHSATHVL